MSRNLATHLTRTFVCVLAFFVSFSAPLAGLVSMPPVEAAAYDFTVKSFDSTGSFMPNQLISLPVSLENSGSEIWSSSGTSQIQLGYLLQGAIANTRTDLVTDVLTNDFATNFTTDATQTVEILIPEDEGIYTFEIVLFDSSNSTFYQSINPEIYQLEVVLPKTPDVTPPTVSISIQGGEPTTIETNISLTLQAEDPNIAGEVSSGLSEYRITQDGDLFTEDWQDWTEVEELVITDSIPAEPNTYTWKAQVRDSVGNESAVFTASIDFVAAEPSGTIAIDVGELVSISPDGSGEELLYAQDTEVQLYLEAQSNVSVTEFRIAETPDIETAAWQSFESTGKSVAQVIPASIPDETGEYTFYAQYKNKFGDLSEVFQSSVHYQKYKVEPSVELSSQDVLYGAEMIISARLKNKGVDIGYNAGFEITLPQGFVFIEPVTCEEIAVGCDSESYPDQVIAPTFVATNAEGLQVLVYEGIADLLTGESVTIHARTTVGGEPEGYEIGETVSIPIRGTLHNRSNFTAGNHIDYTLEVILQPFIVDFESDDTSCGENCTEEQLVEELIENKVTITTNPDVASDSPEDIAVYVPAEEPEEEAEPSEPLEEPEEPADETGEEIPLIENPLEIQFELDNGTSYIDGTQKVYVNGQLVDVDEYNITFQYFDDLINGNPVLTWIFGDTVDVSWIVEVYFDSKIDKIEDESLLGIDFVEHEQKITEKLEVQGRYTNDEEAPETYVEARENNITAKYFTVDKFSTPWRTDIQQVIQYTIRISTSQEYDLSGIEITDILPDGVTFTESQANISFSEDLLLTLHNFSIDPETGQEILKWRIHDENGVVAGTTYEFSYDVFVDATYDEKAFENDDNRIVSRDHLRSMVEVQGFWSDIRDGETYTREEPLNERKIEDTDWAGNRTYEVQFNEGIARVPGSEYVRELDVRIGDQLSVFAEAQFPENIPTHDFVYRIYLPIGTELSDAIDISIMSAIPFEQKEITGGYEFSFGTVPAGTLLRIEYQLNILDDINLKEAVQTRNLFRAEYKNVDNKKFTYRENVTLTMIEPHIEVQKKVVSGYLAAGEEAIISLRVANTGTDTAYGVSVEDMLPTYTTRVDNSITIQPDTIAVTEIEEILSISDLMLEPGEEMLLQYSVIADDEVLFGTPIDSTVLVSEFSSRAVDDPLPARQYEAQENNYSWNAQESLLITSAPEVALGRSQFAEAVFEVTPVGKTPVYDVAAVVDFSELESLLGAIELSDIVITKDGIAIEDTFITLDASVLTIFDQTLLPNESLTITIPLNSPRLIAYDLSAHIPFSVTGVNALDEFIRKDGSVETERDTDIDDASIGIVRIEKTDSELPVGTVSIVVDEQETALTNNTNVDAVTYSATDNTEIAAVRFSNDGVTWATSALLPEIEEEVLDALALEGMWNAWDGSVFVDTENTVLAVEGENYRYMEIVDIEGNIAIVHQEITRDTRPPVFAEALLSPFEDDFSNLPFTASFTNFINFYAIEDTSETDAVSGIGMYSYCMSDCEVPDVGGWSVWEVMTESNNSALLDFPPVDEGSELTAYLRVRDLAGNEFATTLIDTIVYDREYPQVSLLLEAGVPFTNQTEVELYLDIQDSIAGVDKMRFNVSESCSGASTDIQVIPNNSVDTLEEETCYMTEWEELDTEDAFGDEGKRIDWDTILDRFLPQFWVDGEKNVCIQLQDMYGNQSNVACDTISLDRTSPYGFIIINDGALQTQDFAVTLSLSATDPLLADNSLSSRALQMRFSGTGQDCDALNSSEAQDTCQTTWTEWMGFSSSHDWLLDSFTGTHTVYVQYRDGVGNKSPVYSDDIVYNPYQSEGNIIINKDNVFTNTKIVSLDLDVNIHDFYCPQCTEPLLMRFYQTEGTQTPPNPPVVDSPSDNQRGWTYWEEYQESKTWDLDPGNIGDPRYGVKNVFVQYMLPNTETTALYSDTIIYAPYYGVQYVRDQTWNVLDEQNQRYGLGRIPNTLVSQEQIAVTFNAKNIGSFTWPAQDSGSESQSPVRFSYTWTRVDTNQPAGVFGGEGNFAALNTYRGNSVILPDNISWDRQTGEMTLMVDTPVFPGEYELMIDAVHEGNAWFGEYGNETPQYAITVIENPDVPTPTPGIDSETGEVLGIDENIEFGIGGSGSIPFPTDHGNCADTYGRNYAGTTCYIGGILQKNSDYRYDYQIWGQLTNDPSQTRKFHFIPGVDYDHLLGEEVLAQVYYHNNSHQFWINWMGVAPKSWISEFRASDNDSQITQIVEVNRGMSFTVQPRLFNNGTAIWYSDENYLVAVGDKKYGEGGAEAPSSFYNAATWHSRSRIQLDHNHSGYGYNTLGRFTFQIDVPDDIDLGLHTQCFVMTNEPYRHWQRRDSFCMRFNIVMDYEEERDYVCSQPQEVYRSRSTSSSIIGYLQEDDRFVVTADYGDWIQGYLPTSGDQGWIERPDGEVGDNYDCFDNIVRIDNPIPAPEFEVLPEPEGDKGYVIVQGDIPVKDGPADSFNTITQIDYGTEVQVLREANLIDRFGGWLYVRIDRSYCEESELIDNQCEGWIPKGTLHHVNDPEDVPISFKPAFAKGHICGEPKQVRTGPGDWYPLASKEEVSGNFNFAIIMQWEQPNGEVWYQIYLDDNETGPFDLRTGWIKGLEDVCEGIFVPIFNPACSGQLAWPFEQQWTITSRHGSVNPSRPGHDGLDIGVQIGVPVLASADGYISFAGADQYGGLYVDVVHPSLGLMTRYLHLSYIDRYSGTIVEGQQVGLSGNTGYSTGPHLHFGVFDIAANKDVNPEDLLAGGAGACEFEGDDKGEEGIFHSLMVFVQEMIPDMIEIAVQYSVALNEILKDVEDFFSQWSNQTTISDLERYDVTESDIINGYKDFRIRNLTDESPGTAGISKEDRYFSIMSRIDNFIFGVPEYKNYLRASIYNETANNNIIDSPLIEIGLLFTRGHANVGLSQVGPSGEASGFIDQFLAESGYTEYDLITNDKLNVTVKDLWVVDRMISKDLNSPSYEYVANNFGQECADAPRYCRELWLNKEGVRAVTQLPGDGTDVSKNEDHLTRIWNQHCNQAGKFETDFDNYEELSYTPIESRNICK